MLRSLCLPPCNGSCIAIKFSIVNREAINGTRFFYLDLFLRNKTIIPESNLLRQKNFISYLFHWKIKDKKKKEKTFCSFLFTCFSSESFVKCEGRKIKISFFPSEKTVSGRRVGGKTMP